MRFSPSKMNSMRVLDHQDYNNLVEYIDELVNEVNNLKRQLLLLDNNTPTGGSNTFLAIIDGSSADGDNKWKYTWTEVVKTGEGYTVGSWVAREGGLSGTVENGLYARNLKEYISDDNNPITNNSIVQMRTIRLLNNGIEYWFTDISSFIGSIENPKVLTWDPTAAPASDSWNREEDKIALQETEIRGIRYDEETHRLQVKYRVKLYDSLGILYSVSEETGWTDIVQFVEHP